jgi:FIST N domain
VSTATINALAVARAHATGTAAEVVTGLTGDLRAGLAGRRAAAVVWFASDQVTGTGGVSAIAFPQGLLVRAAAALGDLAGDVPAGTDAVVTAVETAFGPLRELNPAKHLALVLIDGMHADEETLNERLGNAAPMLDIVGASAGDDLAFARTWVALGDRVSDHGVVLLVAETGVPFRVVKTCSFTPSGLTLRITKADVPNRTVLEFDGRPALEAYAAAIGVDPLPGRRGGLHAAPGRPHDRRGALDPQPADRHPPGTPAVLRPDPRGHGRRGDGRRRPGRRDRFGHHRRPGRPGRPLRRRNHVQLHPAPPGDRRKGLANPFLASFSGVPVAGFHTYGETWLGHVNQTLTGIIFG